VASIHIYTELLVPLLVPVRRAARIHFLAESDADPPQRGDLHRLRQVREDLPCILASRRTGADSFRRVHGLYGVRGGLSCAGRLGDEPTEPATCEDKANSSSRLGHGRRNRRSVLWCSRFCQGGRALEFRDTHFGLRTAGAQRGSSRAPDAGKVNEHEHSTSSSSESNARERGFAIGRLGQL
jgi:hypothetical protein